MMSSMESLENTVDELISLWEKRCEQLEEVVKIKDATMDAMQGTIDSQKEMLDLLKKELGVA